MNAEANIVVAVTNNSGDGETLGNNSPINNTASAPNPTDNNDERTSCKFGRQCFRQNPRHRSDMAHPGDVDYTVPDMPEPLDGAAKCKYGRQCYRLNPEHFKNFQHPRNINIQENYRKYVLKRQGNRRNSDSFDYNFSDDDDNVEPFSGDSDTEYNPSDDNDDDKT